MRHTSNMERAVSERAAHYFIAVPLPSAVKQQLYAWSKQLNHRYFFKKWVHIEDYHITLKFLGAVHTNKLEQIKLLMTDLAKQFGSFPLSIQGLGTFGRTDTPRIVWAGVQGDLQALTVLQKSIEHDLQELGFPSENRPYAPHVTLAKNYTGSERFDQVLAQSSIDFTKLDLTVKEFVLYQTHLGQKPMYEQKAAFSFF